jgi:hypothetical protein
VPTSPRARPCCAPEAVRTQLWQRTRTPPHLSPSASPSASPNAGSGALSASTKTLDSDKRTRKADASAAASAVGRSARGTGAPARATSRPRRASGRTFGCSQRMRVPAGQAGGARVWRRPARAGQGTWDEKHRAREVGNRHA